MALVDNYAGLLVLRFLTGFMGSPCLATGAATMQDMVSIKNAKLLVDKMLNSS
jgi:DHA1 family multidrug resistance protein-like MFS transporter